MGKKEKNSDVGSQMTEFSSSTKIAPGVIGEYHEKDELYDPFDHRDKKNTNSDLGSLAHLLKSSLGTGILAMPSAVKNGGLIFGSIGTIVIGIVCAHCVHILVRTSQILCRRTKTPQMTYAETAYNALLCGPTSTRPYANASRIFVNSALCATYVGGACVYIVFISTSIKQAADHYTGMDIPIRTYIVALIPAVILLGQLRNLKYLVPFSVVANISMMISFAITLYYIFSDLGQKSFDNVKMFSSVGQLPKFFATVIFAIEGIGTVMPIENSMKKPQHFLGCPSVLNITMTIVVALYATMGVFGYVKYGEGTHASITLNIPPKDVLGQAVNLLIALSVLFTYGLQFFVPLQIIWDSIKHMFSHKYEGLAETIMRIFMVLMTVSVACLVPKLDPFISLVGAVFFSILGITIPAVIETISCWEGHLGMFKWRLYKNILLVIFSLFALAFGAHVSILEIIDLYR
ncbi:proton-coupled amino acid transporter-like protein pathetic [Prorops nasuta]|uniref:proton-coupled amino acid transporter-like protein pathetic n=1 Tax=Prorops nasuta TaxID=863751 RepID=UPI0034D008B5